MNSIYYAVYLIVGSILQRIKRYFLFSLVTIPSCVFSHLTKKWKLMPAKTLSQSSISRVFCGLDKFHDFVVQLRAGNIKFCGLHQQNNRRRYWSSLCIIVNVIESCFSDWDRTYSVQCFAVFGNINIQVLVKYVWIEKEYLGYVNLEFVFAFVHGCIYIYGMQFVFVRLLRWHHIVRISICLISVISYYGQKCISKVKFCEFK